MKIRNAVVVILCLSMVQCATYYHIFEGPQSTFYTEQEKQLLEKTTKSIDFDYGYDQDMDLDYVFPRTQGYTEFKPGDRDLSQALDGVDDNTLIAFSEKIYWLKKFTVIKMDEYGKSGNWKFYTYINKYLLPSIDHYAAMVEKQAVRRDNYQYEIEKRKKSIDNKIRKEMLRREFEELWRYDYNS